MRTQLCTLALRVRWMVTDDLDADMERFRAFYDGIEGRFPELQTPIRRVLLSLVETPANLLKQPGGGQSGT